MATFLMIDGSLGAAVRARRTLSQLGPPLVVIAVVVGLQVAYEVRLGDALLYLGFEATFAIIPGVLTYRALSRRRGGWLRQVTIGWSLGYALQVLVFIATAATDTRVLFLAYPLAVSIPALWAFRRRPADGHPNLPDPATLWWIVSGVCALAVAYLAFSYFPLLSLPGRQAVHYQQDFPWAISLAGDALHHWPIQDPNVAGLPMPYHFFVHIHLAAASQVTGLSLPLIVFRLYSLPLIVLVALQIVVAGQSLVRSTYSGVAAAGLFLLVNQVNLIHTVIPAPFLGASFAFLSASPSFIFGIVFFVPLLVLVGETISFPDGSVRGGDWLLLSLLMVGASDAKVVILPMMVAALVLYGCWHAATRRRVPRTVLITAALAAGVFLTVWVVQYRGHSSGFQLDTSAGYRFFTVQMAAVSYVKSYTLSALGSFPGANIVVSAGSILFGAIGLFGAQLAGVFWFLRARRLRFEAREAWLLCIFTVGLLAVLVADTPGSGNVLYCLTYGTVAICTISAAGLRELWLRQSPVMRAHLGQTATLGLAGIGVLGVAALLAARLLSGHPSGLYFAGFGRAYLWSFVTLVAGLGLLFLVAGGRWFRGGRVVAAALITGVVVVAGLLDTPEQISRFGIGPVAAVASGRRVTPDLYAAMVWIREHTAVDAVIAVNNAEGLEFDYAAFSERRTFLGGWGYSLPSKESGVKDFGSKILGAVGRVGEGRYADRVSLNDRVFLHADRDAIKTVARDYGVRYLVVDRINGFPVDDKPLRQIARPVFATPEVSVFKLRGFDTK